METIAPNPGYIVEAYSAYLVISIGLVIWVAVTLRRNGRLFLVDACHKNEALADSLNHLLNVGFYLVSLGMVSFLLPMEKPENPQAAIEALSTHEGRVLMLLGGIHFLYLGLIARARRQAHDTGLPFTPDAELPAPTV